MTHITFNTIDVKRTHQRLSQQLDNHLATTQRCITDLMPMIVDAGAMLIDALGNGKKIMSCGNGGSAADAQHFSSELLNRYDRDRPGLAAVALTTDSSTLTSIANDYNYDDIYAKQVHALGQKGDILLAITTSGQSRNILKAVEAAHEVDIRCIAFNGKQGGKLSQLLNDQDLDLRIDTDSTARIQETHIFIIHCLCDIIDQQLND